MSQKMKSQKAESEKKQILEQVAGLSKLLGMVPSDEAIELRDPMTHDSIVIGEWLTEARSRLLSLSVLIGKELDIR